MAYNLRADIMKQRNRKYLQKDMHPNEETKMLGFVSDYVTGKLLHVDDRCTGSKAWLCVSSQLGLADFLFSMKHMCS